MNQNNNLSKTRLFAKLLASLIIPFVAIMMYQMQMAKNTMTSQVRSNLEAHVTQTQLLCQMQNKVIPGNVTSKEINEIREAVLGVKIGQTGYMYVMNSKGDIVIHPKLTSTDNLSKYDFAQEMMSKKNGWVNYIWQGRPKLLYYAYYQPWDWIIAAGSYEDDIYSDIRTVRNYSLFALLLALIFVIWRLNSFVDGNLFIQKVIDMIRQCSEDAQKGNLSARLDVSSIKEEFRPVLNNMNALLDAIVNPLREISAMLIKLSTNDLRARANNQFQGEFESLRAAANQLAERFQSAIENISLNTYLVASTATEMNVINEQLKTDAAQTSNQATSAASATEEISKSVETVAAASEEMSISIKEISKNTSEATRVANEAVQITEKTNAIIIKLGESSTEIGKVIKLITTIAEQTNILALNATVEAARAGVAGKGFAVVANEVKGLALVTTKATRDIGHRIEQIQVDTKTSVEAIQQISEVIKKIDGISLAIAGAIEEQSATSSEIGRNISEAAKATKEISQNVSEVAKAAQSTAHATVNAQAASEKITKVSSDLKELIARFTYK